MSSEVLSPHPDFPVHDPRWVELNARLTEVNDLRRAASVLHWDQATYMPPGGAEARGRQIATLSRLAHEKFTDARVGELLEDLRSATAGLPAESFEGAVLRVTAHDYGRATKVPAEFEARFSAHLATAYETWAQARPRNDWNAVRPLLEKTLDLSLELSSFYGGEHPADPLIEDSDPGFTVKQVREVFGELRRELVPLVEEVTSRPSAGNAVLRGHFSVETQREVAHQLVTAIGYDWNRGRMDATHHPFMTKFSLGDVRITIRSRDNEATELLFGALHEAGHALYEQGIDRRTETTPLSSGASSGLHESQSRLWENLVGRSPQFWQFAYPTMQSHFSAQLGDVSLDTFVGAINTVERSLIRTEADELTYNLHVMIRFELELAMLEGRLSVADLPEAWRSLYREYLGVASEDDRNGCMQDVHWYGGAIGGAFQGYTLGNILSAQFFEAATRELGDVPAQIARGEFTPLREWLTQNLYRFGRALEPSDLIQNATGSPLASGPYLKYLKGKFLS